MEKFSTITFSKSIRYIIIIFILMILFSVGARLENTDEEINKVSKFEKEKFFAPDPEISNNEIYYKVENIVDALEGDNYRLNFDIWSDEDAQVDVRLVSSSGNEMQLADLDIKKDEHFNNRYSKEITFRTDNPYSDLVFTKKDTNNHEKVYIKDLKMVRLNSSKEAETNTFKPTIIGETKIFSLDSRQSQDRGELFNQLGKSNIIFGQSFKATGDYMVGITLNLEAVGSGGAGTYEVELRKASGGNGAVVVDPKVIASVGFRSDEMMKYLQKDGTINLPLATPLKKGEYYFLGINNGFARVNSFNYLRIHGSGNNNSYKDGGLFVLGKNGIKAVSGDFYFQIIGAKYSFYDNTRLLTKSIIEDLGNGSGLFSYKNRNEFTDFLDLYSYSQEDPQLNEVRYSYFEGVVAGSPVGDTNYIYKIDTIYPFRKLKFSAEQAYPYWYLVKIYYSFDQNNWSEVSCSQTGDNYQIFDQIINGDGKNNTVYFKVTYDKDDKKDTKLFGLRKMSIQGNLIMN